MPCQGFVAVDYNKSRILSARHLFLERKNSITLLLKWHRKRHRCRVSCWHLGGKKIWGMPLAVDLKGLRSTLPQTTKNELRLRKKNANELSKLPIQKKTWKTWKSPASFFGRDRPSYAEFLRCLFFQQNLSTPQNNMAGQPTPPLTYPQIMVQ